MKYHLNGTWVNDSTVTTLPPGATLLTATEWSNRQSAPYVPPLPEAKERKIASLEQSRDAAERADVTVSGKVYSGSEAFQAKVSRTINQSGRGKPVAGANDAWRTADAQPVVMTATLLGQIEDAISAQGAASWARFWLRFDAVQAASTNAAVDVIVW